jgi:branched-chain amino acid transport system permease protein
MKTKGHYLALVTIAFQFIVVILLDNLEFTGGPQGLKNIPLFSLVGYSFNTEVNLFGLTFPTYVNFYFLMVVLAVVTVIIANRIYQSWVGVTLATIRDDEIAAKTSGVEINKWKLIAFSVGNFFIGLSGAFFAHMVGFISPPNFGFEKSLVMVSIVILGGMDNVAGVILGAILLILLPEKLRFISDYRFLIYGMVLMLMLIFRPRGILPFRVRDYAGFPPRAGLTATKGEAEK